MTLVDGQLFSMGRKRAVFHRAARKLTIKPSFVVICTYVRHSVYYSLMHWVIFKEVLYSAWDLRL